MSLIKICGLSRLEDIEAANACLPDFIGFVFAESRRRVTAGQAAVLKERLSPRIKAVGVFVNAPLEEVRALREGGVIDMAQLHGDEDEEYMRRLKDVCHIPIIKALRLGASGQSGPPSPQAGGTDGELARGADYLLFDAFTEGERGGSGNSFDWSLTPPTAKPFFLAGGLGAGNLAEAIRRLRPYGVDLSSGAEIDGRKDFGLMSRLVEIARREA
ncbi:MAG: phosphoribosylanthranilate isomerase [Clostridiales Family XIII bacterium]|jgi:phosphoribosylanthranilate isomerase|nr:phosphoribosylanthranilate isomerase [Clostridiales Family XIII bacterium]